MASDAGSLKECRAVPSGILVTDFDGTLTYNEFYELVMELIPPGTRDLWPDFQAGHITHFEYLQRTFATIRGEKAQLREIMERCQLDPRAGESIRRLQQAGWSVIVASAGCGWYVSELLASRGIDVPVISNPGSHSPEGGLTMQRHDDPRYTSTQYGIDKAAVVREALLTTRRVAFAGNGTSDFEAARLVDAELRFARQDLARLLNTAGLAYHPFDMWSEVAERLLRQ